MLSNKERSFLGMNKIYINHTTHGFQFVVLTKNTVGCFNSCDDSIQSTPTYNQIRRQHILLVTPKMHSYINTQDKFNCLSKHKPVHCHQLQLSRSYKPNFIQCTEPSKLHYQSITASKSDEWFSNKATVFQGQRTQMSPKYDHFWGLPYSYQVTSVSHRQFFGFFARKDTQRDIPNDTQKCR